MTENHTTLRELDDTYPRFSAASVPSTCAADALHELFRMTALQDRCSSTSRRMASAS